MECETKARRVLMFMHGNLHETKALESINENTPHQEVKYVLRTDVMYRKLVPYNESQ